MGSKPLILLALVAAAVLAYVVVTSLSDDRLDTGGNAAVKPEEADPEIVAPPPLDEDPEQPVIEGEPASLAVLVVDEEGGAVPGAAITTNIDKMPQFAKAAVVRAGEETLGVENFFFEKDLVSFLQPGDARFEPLAVEGARRSDDRQARTRSDGTGRGIEISGHSEALKAISFRNQNRIQRERQRMLPNRVFSSRKTTTAGIRRSLPLPKAPHGAMGESRRNGRSGPAGSR